MQQNIGLKLTGHPVEGLHRKISHDIMEVWKRNVQPLYDKEMEEMSKSKDIGGSTMTLLVGSTRFEDRKAIQ